MPELIGGIGIQVKPVGTLLEEDALKANSILDAEEAQKKYENDQYSGLFRYVIREFQKNRDNKIESGIEEEIIESLEQFNGEYSAKDLSLIRAAGGSEIFMNLTAVKARAAKSWIADVYQSAKGHTWEFDDTPVPDLPDNIEELILNAIQREFEEATKAQAPDGQPMSVEMAQETLRESNQKKRDIQSIVTSEISKESSFQMKKMERKVRDQLTEGKWDKSLLTFIDDFVVYPTAFIMGPIVSKQKTLKWVDGQATEVEDYFFTDKRIDPLDVYPSAGATETADGNLAIHVRYETKSDIANLKGLPGYNSKAIDRVLESGSGGGNWYFDTGIEQEKADQERRSNTLINDTYIHGLNFYGSALTNDLKEWDEESKKFKELEDDKYVEVEVIAIGNEVIKCTINEHPLKLRPIHKASFINRPGSFWGRSLPMLMKDIQRMCNAVARALSNNMAFASGPSMEIIIDRLADSGDIEAAKALQIWQTKADPTGSGGRAIQWFQPSSNAAELLKVYGEFEARADDVTGIPRWAYGNEKLAGAGTTYSGLALILESTSKIIKDAIRNIDEGAIKPRVEHQFYYNMKKDPVPGWTGDVKVVARGAEVLTIKAFEALRRNEFLQITANQFDQTVMGAEGRADVLRAIADDLGLTGNPIPTSYEIKQREKLVKVENEKTAQAQAQAEQEKNAVSLEASTRQIDGQERMANQAQEINLFKAEMEDKIKQMDLILKSQELELKTFKEQSSVALAKEKIDSDKSMQNKEIAIKLISPDKKGI
jgi:hypothetical protein